MKEIRIEGYLARDKELGDGFPGELFLYGNKPARSKSYWKGRELGIDINDSEFPEITWNTEPVKCVITIATVE